MLGHLYVLVLATTAIATYPGCAPVSAAGCSTFRLPPPEVNSTLAGSNWTDWQVAPPSGFRWGTYAFSHTSQSAYLELVNAAQHSYPILPTTSNVSTAVDLTSYYVSGSSVTTYGIDTDLNVSYAYNYTTTRGNATDLCACVPGCAHVQMRGSAGATTRAHKDSGSRTTAQSTTLYRRA